MRSKFETNSQGANLSASLRAGELQGQASSSVQSVGNGFQTNNDASVSIVGLYEANYESSSSRLMSLYSGHYESQNVTKHGLFCDSETKNTVGGFNVLSQTSHEKFTAAGYHYDGKITVLNHTIGYNVDIPTKPLTNAVDAVVDTTSSTVETVSEVVGDASNTVVDGVKQAAGVVGDAVSTVYNQVDNNVEQIAKGTVHSFGRFFKGVGDAVTSNHAAQVIGKTLQSAGEAVASSNVAAGLGHVSKEVSGLASRIPVQGVIKGAHGIFKNVDVKTIVEVGGTIVKTGGAIASAFL
jgi:hypothetical protein